MGLADEGERRQKALPTFRREFKKATGVGSWMSSPRGERQGSRIRGLGGCYVARILKSIKYARDCFTTWELKAKSKTRSGQPAKSSIFVNLLLTRCQSLARSPSLYLWIPLSLPFLLLLTLMAELVLYGLMVRKRDLMFVCKICVFFSSLSFHSFGPAP